MNPPTDQNVRIGECLTHLGVRLMPLERHSSNGQGSSLEGDALSSAVIAAFARPLGFPPLAEATVPGDHAAIAVDETIPNLAPIIIGAIQALSSAGVDRGDITVVTAVDKTCSHLQSSLADSDLPDVRVVNHDPTSRLELCLAGTTRAGRPLLINRTLFEADVLLPISCCRFGLMSSTTSAYGGLYPRFSDIETLRRWNVRDVFADGWTADHLAEVTEAGWLLGASLVVQVVPGTSGRVAHVLAGDPQQVATESARLYQHLWWTRVAQRCSLAIVTVGRDNEPVGWDQVARAVQTAEGVLNEDGALVVCCGRLPPPGNSLRRLANVVDWAAAERQIARNPDRDTWAARCLSHALQRGPVYIFSPTDADAVEELGMAPVDDIAEIARLANRHRCCVVLEDAEHVVVRVEEEMA